VSELILPEFSVVQTLNKFAFPCRYVDADTILQFAGRSLSHAVIVEGHASSCIFSYPLRQWQFGFVLDTPFPRPSAQLKEMLNLQQDWVISLADEWNLIWKSKWTLGKSLYIFLR
jgi:hypothetical protein